MTALRHFVHCVLLAFVFTGLSNVSSEPNEVSTVSGPRYARNFEIVDFPTHRIATVRISENDSIQLYQYALVTKEVPLPELPKHIPVIRTPVKRVVVLETVYIGFLDKLQQLDSIIGAGTANYISNPTVRQRIEKGIIQTVSTGQALNVERLLLLKPELIFTSVPSEPTSNIPAQLQRVNLPVVVTAGYREPHPLARAEWIKFISAFFDASEEADITFNAVANRYEALLQKVDTIKERPTVFCGAPYSGVWHMAEGDSYLAQLIEDAGGNYLWSYTTGTGTIPLNVERVFSKAAKADIWLNPGIYRSQKALLAADARFAKFDAVRTGLIYNHTRQQTAATGNPIWETGMIEPDNVLADLIKILHPNRVPDWEFVYYEELN